LKAKACFVLLALVLFSQTNMKGMSLGPSTPRPSSSPLGLAYYLSKVIARTADGKSHYGLLTGVEGDELILKRGTNEERISYRDISEVSVESKKNTGAFMTSGMVLGIYLGNLLYRAEGQPVAYVPEGASFIWDFVFASAGIGLGYLAGLFEKDEVVFQFDGGAEDRLAEWGRLKSFLAGRLRDKKIHLSIQAARVFTSVFQRYRNAFASAGYYTSSGFYPLSPGSSQYDYEKRVEPAARFNLLRKAQLTVSLQPKIDVGAAVVFSGEPGVGGTRWEDGGYRAVWQTYESVGYYAVAVYKPLLGILPEKVQWGIGVGAGASRVDFELGLHSEEYYQDYEEKWARHQITQTVPSGLAFTELSFFFGPNTSLGLTADYVFGPSRNVPEFPEWNLPAQKIRLGNGSLGVVFGMHF
jgi:hypothetical protein